MLKYRGTKLFRAGVLGVVLIVLVIAVGLNPERLTSWATSVRYGASFADGGGLAVGNDVAVSGVKVGTVTDISVQQGMALVEITINSTVALGSDSTAHIRTGTLLGARVVTLDSAGSHSMHPGDVIPISRTSSPYSLTDAVSDLTTNTAGTDTASLNNSLDTLSATIDQIAPQLGPTFDGLTRLSTALNGNELVGVLNDRRQAIVQLIASTAAVAQQLSGLVADNEKQLAPALEKLNSVTAMLEKNRDNIGKMLPGLAKYQITQAEAVSSGFYYNAFLPNLQPVQLIQPFLDYAFGFRRGVNAGRPPDNAGPRAEFPFPYNGIPGGSR
jgi:phospholipid/cholesterol/gamma-HCH transport system substrate-binding protein